MKASWTLEVSTLNVKWDNFHKEMKTKWDSFIEGEQERFYNKGA